MKAVLVSIKPKYCELIASGKKTVEVRKTRPKIDTPFKCYIYHTRNPISVTFNGTGRHISEYDRRLNFNENSGKVIGEFICDNISVFEYKDGGYLVNGDISTTISVQAQSCLTDYQFRKYAGEKSCYGWHISNLVIYDKSKELSEFYKKCDNGCGNNCEHWKYVRVNADEFDMDCKSDWFNHKPLKRPPQSWCYVEEVKNDR